MCLELRFLWSEHDRPSVFLLPAEMIGLILAEMTVQLTCILIGALPVGLGVDLFDTSLMCANGTETNK